MIAATLNGAVWHGVNIETAFGYLCIVVALLWCIAEVVRKAGTGAEEPEVQPATPTLPWVAHGDDEAA